MAISRFADTYFTTDDKEFLTTIFGRKKGDIAVKVFNNEEEWAYLQDGGEYLFVTFTPNSPI
jgi:hypothetical protein